MTSVSQAVPPSPAVELRRLLTERNPQFFDRLRRCTAESQTFDQTLALSTVRRRAAKMGFVEPGLEPVPLRLAMLGGYSLYPLHEIVQHWLECAGYPRGLQVELFQGAYDNYVSEILDEGSALYAFRPQVILFLPSERRCKYAGNLLDDRQLQEHAARTAAKDLLDLCSVAHRRSGAEVIMTNFLLPARFDPGPFRVRSLASDWTFRKLVNLELGLGAPSFVHICDVEFLGSRRGTLRCVDPRAWFESKQPYTAEFLVDVAREVNHIVSHLRKTPKKVVVLDLDNTLWGGVVGDDGLEGIEIGDTSPRGEAFKSFQQYLLSLTSRGILLAVCSKNDREKAVEPFEKHPEMVLRMKDFVSFKADWNPKSDNIRQIAAELNLGLDSFVFVDDNPAEIEIVRQFVPEVEGVLLGPDPSEYASRLQDARLFEPLNVTAEDAERVQQYKIEAQRQQMQSSCTDMASYLASLEMEGIIAEFQPVDVPRISQLINKSNQFNLTTRRRTEAEVQAIMQDPAYAGFTVRLADKFGDHGLISVVIGRFAGDTLEIDTWLMSCRVLKRQVEEEVVNEMVRLARHRGCRSIRGSYISTAKNGMVRDLYPRMGFTLLSEEERLLVFELDVIHYRNIDTAIAITRRTNDAN